MRSEHAETADKIQSTLLATVSHEIRTPLNGVIACRTGLGLGCTSMKPLLDLELLIDLYPDTATRNDFLRRARQVLSADRVALSAALARRNHGEARQLAHRIQGTTAFLNGARERTLELFGALNQGLAQCDLDQITAACEPVLVYLSGLETALLSATEVPGDCRNA